MTAFTVTIARLGEAPFSYTAISADAGAASEAAADQFAPCGISVRPLETGHAPR
jgi:hypothetical protein